MEWEAGKKNKQIKRAHKSCRQIRVDRENTHIEIAKILEVPVIEKDFVIACDEWHKLGYNWDVILHAFKQKLFALNLHRDKNPRYRAAIVKSQLNASFKFFKDEEKRKLDYEKLSETFVNYEPSEDISFTPSKSKNDISNLL